MPKRNPKKQFLILALILIALVFIAVIWGLPRIGIKLDWRWAALIGVNLVTLLFYFVDKQAAKSEKGRIPEVILHLLAAIGGSPTAVLSQRLMRHKNRKVPFQILTWLIVIVQIALLVFWQYHVRR